MVERLESQNNQDQKMSMSKKEQEPFPSEKQQNYGQCKVRGHEKMSIRFLETDQTQKGRFICDLCISNDESRPHSFISLEQIMIADANTVFYHHPNLPETKDYFKQTKNLQNQSFEESALECKKKFAELRIYIGDQLKKAEATYLERMESQYSTIKNIQDQYNSISEKFNLQNIILNQDIDLNEKTSLCDQILNRVLNNTQQNQEILKEATRSLSIISKVNEYDYFNHLKQSMVSEFNCFIKLIENENQNLEEQLFNQQQFLPEHLEASLKNISDSVEPIKANLENIIQMQLDVNAGYFNQNREEINARDYEQVGSKMIMEIIKNKANFCPQDFCDSVNKTLGLIESILKLFKVRKISPLNSYQISFNQIFHSQLVDIAKLADIINDLNVKHKDRYLSCTYLQESIQQNSFLIKKYLRNIRPKSRMEEIINLLIKYPIFDLIPVMKTGHPLPILFEKTNYGDSQQMEIKQYQEEVQISLACNKEGQVVSGILNNKKAYSLKIKLGFPYRIEKVGHLRIGLIQDSDKDEQKLLYYDRINAGFYSNSLEGARIIVRGVNLSSEMNTNISELEFRWCINERKFYILDSSYENINKVEEMFFNPNLKYRFGIMFDKFSETNQCCSITEFFEITELEKFD